MQASVMVDALGVFCVYVGVVKAAVVWVGVHCISLSPAGFSAAVEEGEYIVVWRTCSL